MTPEPRVAC